MSFGKTNDERLDGVISFIQTHFPMAKRIVENRIANLGAQKTPISNALSLGARDNDKSAAETERRNGVRTLLFLAFTEGKQPIALAEVFKNKYVAMNLQQIKREVSGRLPVDDNSPDRIFWAPNNFTIPPNTPQMQDAPAKFRYIVCGMMNADTKRGTTYDVILGHPDILKTFMLSTSIIDQDHRSTYYPYSFTISVPKSCILSTSSGDQAFKNYRAEDPQDELLRTGEPKVTEISAEGSCQ